MLDVLSDEYFEARRIDIKERVSNHRYAHVCGVAACAEELAKTYGVNPSMARLAGLLHDWDKCFDDEQIRARVEELNLEIDPFVLDKLPRVLHADTAAVALKNEFPELPCEVLSAIKKCSLT